jgi:hypothetical protein
VGEQGIRLGQAWKIGELVTAGLTAYTVSVATVEPSSVHAFLKREMARRKSAP